MAEEKSNNYISLQEAAKYCSYTQEYLSLRARQGKLKAVKIARNWVTKKEWVKEYLRKAEEYNNNLKAPKHRALNALSARPPENLPIEEIAQVRPVQLRPALSIALVFVLLIAGAVSGKESFKNVYHQTAPLVREINENFDRGLTFQIRNSQFAIRNLADEVSEYTYIISQAGDIIAEKVLKPGQELAAISSPDVLKSTLNTFKEFGQWLNENIKSIYLVANDFVERKISQGFKTISQFFKKPEKIVEEKLIPKPAEEGLVVIPSIEKDEETVKKIKEAFSDEVKVEPKDKTSGIITPIFKEGEGQKYLYLLVPISYEQ